MKSMDFTYLMPTKIIFAEDSSRRLVDLVKGQNLFMMCDPFLYANGTAERLANIAKVKNVSYFHEIEPNPSCQTIDKATELARNNKADVVVGLGGGSAMDAAKMVACLCDNEGSIFDYYSTGNRELLSRTAQLICIPTTSGTGSEVTNIGVYTNRETNIKMPFASKLFWPDIALIDPILTHTLPQIVTASTGMDAFCHAIEAYWSLNSNPVSEALSVSALRYILGNIEVACLNPADRTAREKMSLASVMAGISFSQTKTTGIHAVSFPLTSEFGASHGIACSINLTSFIRIVYPNNTEKFDCLLESLGFKTIDSFILRIEEIMKNIGLPVRLSELGVNLKDIEHIAEVSLKSPLILNTPCEIDKEGITSLLKSIL